MRGFRCWHLGTASRRLRRPKATPVADPAILRRPYALTPIKVASLELVPESVSQPEPTAPEGDGGPSTEERQSREAEVELERCLAAMGDLGPSTSTTLATPPPGVKSTPEAPAATAIPMWAEIRLRHDTESKRKAYTTPEGSCSWIITIPNTSGGDSHHRPPEDP